MTLRSSLRLHSSSFSLLGASAAALLSGCTGQTGGEIDLSPGDVTENAAGDGCEEISSTELSENETTSVGMTAQELSDAIVGTHEVSLAWGDGNVFDATVTPAAGDSAITIEIRPKPTTGRLVDLEEEVDDGREEGDGDDIAQPAIEPGAAPGEQERCPDRLEVEAEVIVTSDNGAFDDTFDMVFWTNDGQTITGSIDIEPGNLTGSFDVEPASDDARSIQNTFSIRFAYGAMSGEIAGLIEETSGSGDAAAVSAGTNVYGRFPAEGCDDGALIPEGSELSDALIDLLDSHTEFILNWMDADSTQLTVVPVLQGKICAQGTTLHAAGSVDVTTEDGRIDGTWDIIIRSELQDGLIASTNLSYIDSYEPIAAADFASQTGITGYENEDMQLSVQFDLALETDPPYFGGSFAVFELDVPPCADPDYEAPVVEDPDGEQSSPGCAGIDVIAEHDQASFLESQ